MKKEKGKIKKKEKNEDIRKEEKGKNEEKS